MGANPHANGGLLLRELRLPDFRDYEVKFPTPAPSWPGNVHMLGPWLTRRHETPTPISVISACLHRMKRVSNRLENVFEVTIGNGMPGPKTAMNSQRQKVW